MPDPISQPVPGAAVVCLKGDSVLLVQRGREPNFGRWSFPGGKIHAGETARDAAQREALEETGLQVRVLDVIDVYDAIFPPYHYTVTDYLAEVETTGEPVAQSDVSDARWVPFTETYRYDLTEAMERVLARARWLREARVGAPPSLGMASAESVPAGITGRETLRQKVCGLYVITDETLPPGRSHVETARAALEGGARILQLRDKHRDAGDLLPAAREIAALCRAAGALLVVNDRIDLALAAEADGVHLGQTDLPIEVARRILGPERLIGISVENVKQVLAAESAGADYLGVGPIYGTASKHDAGDAVGIEQIRRFKAVSDLPIVAIGGITLDRLPEVRASGAESAAVISAVVSAPDPVAATRELVVAWEESESR